MILFRNKLFSKFGAFENFVVLFQTSSDKRAQNIARVAREMVCEPKVFTTSYPAVSEETILRGQIWIDQQNELRALLK